LWFLKNIDLKYKRKIIRILFFSRLLWLQGHLKLANLQIIFFLVTLGHIYWKRTKRTLWQLSLVINCWFQKKFQEILRKYRARILDSILVQDQDCKFWTKIHPCLLVEVDESSVKAQVSSRSADISMSLISSEFLPKFLKLILNHHLLMPYKVFFLYFTTATSFMYMK